MTYSKFMQGLLHVLFTTIFIFFGIIGSWYIYPIVIWPVAVVLILLANLWIVGLYNQDECGNVSDRRGYRG